MKVIKKFLQLNKAIVCLILLPTPTCSRLDALVAP
jgi:hypothetical protein